MMVQLSNDGLLQAYDGKMLDNDGEMLVNGGKMLINDRWWNEYMIMHSPSLTSILPSFAWS